MRTEKKKISSLAELKSKQHNHKIAIRNLVSRVEMNYDHGMKIEKDDVLNVEIRMLQNYLLWAFNAEQFGWEINEADTNLLVDFFEFASDYISKENCKRNIATDLKDKCIVAKVHSPKKLYNILKMKLDFMQEDVQHSYKYIYFANLGIGEVTDSGNHRMFAQSIKNENHNALVDIIDDYDFLSKIRTDGAYIYDVAKPNNKTLVKDGNLAALITLVQIKLGIITDIEEYVWSISTNVPYDVEFAEKTKKPSKHIQKRSFARKLIDAT